MRIRTVDNGSNVDDLKCAKISSKTSFGDTFKASLSLLNFEC